MMGSKARRRHRILWVVTASLLGIGVLKTLAPTRVSAAEPAESVDVVQAASVPPSPASALEADVSRAEASPDAEGMPSQATGAEDVQAESASAGAAAAQERRLPESIGSMLRQAREEADTPWHARLVSVLGLLVMLGIAWLLSEDRRMIPWRVVLWGVALQFGFALVILKTSLGNEFFARINDIIVALLGFTVEGARFLFGNLVQHTVPVMPAEPVADGALATLPELVATTGASFAFNVLPTIIFFSSLMTVLYYLGVMQAIVKAMAWVMMRTLGTSGAETLSAAGNIFVGQTEAPLLIKPFVARLTMSELMAVMTAGFATVAGGVMAAYVGMLVAYFPGIAGHLMAASVMSAPAALVIAKIMVPEREEPVTRGVLDVEIENPDANVIDAAARGAGEGLTLALNVGAMLLAFIALIALVNALLGRLADVTHLTQLLQGSGWLAEGQSLTLEVILGWVLAPLAWVMGVPWEDAAVVGSLLGVKTVLNEFVAFLQLSSLLGGAGDLSPRSIVIAVYALAGFANFSSIAIQIGGIGGIAPSRRSDLSRLGLRAMIGGSLAGFMTATIAGILI